MAQWHDTGKLGCITDIYLKSYGQLPRKLRTSYFEPLDHLQYSGVQNSAFFTF